jgi:hypothetical protein
MRMQSGGEEGCGAETGNEKENGAADDEDCHHEKSH